MGYMENQAHARRDAITAELVGIDREIAKLDGAVSSSAMRTFLKEQREALRARLHRANEQLAEQGGGGARRAAIGAASRDACGEWCACGKLVIGQSDGSTMFFYCQDCGADWRREDANRSVPPPRQARIRQSLCHCTSVCRFCRKPKRHSA